MYHALRANSTLQIRGVVFLFEYLFDDKVNTFSWGVFNTVYHALRANSTLQVQGVVFLFGYLCDDEIYIFCGMYLIRCITHFVLIAPYDMGVVFLFEYLFDDEVNTLSWDVLNTVYHALRANSTLQVLDWCSISI